MTQQQSYRIGTPGTPWGEAERAAWRAAQLIKRSYQEEVANKITALGERFTVQQYGALPQDPDRYPLYAVQSRDWHSNKKTVLITGGVHGYETSGVQGAIRFLETQAERYTDTFNIVVTPCISPWGYETINRWNAGAIDPNRSFYANSPAEEAAALMRFISTMNLDIYVHIDLHETTDTDNSEFRPALCARDAVEHGHWDIPDGFYLVGNTENPVPDFQKAIIESVEKITHIAPADAGGMLIGEPLEQRGVINYAARALGLCMGLTDAQYSTTTEAYPDSDKVDDENCTQAQVAVITGGLDFVLGR